MRLSTVIMIGVAAVFGLLAVFVAKSWLDNQSAARMKTLQANKPQQVITSTVVVASRALRFGNELNASSAKEVPWSEDAIPAGAFKTLKDLGAAKRVVLVPLEPNEPILASKITGPGQRATLSAVIGEGRKAVTIRVNDVDGVAGFVLPGDRVDVLLSRQVDKTAAFNDVVLKNARVLATDQLADERSEKPSVAKAVTLEVDIAGAQKLSLAAQIGSLSLVLRKAGDTETASSRPITLADLINSKSADEPSDDGKFATVTVSRAGTKTIQSVPREGGGVSGMAGLGDRSTVR